MYIFLIAPIGSFIAGVNCDLRRRTEQCSEAVCAAEHVHRRAAVRVRSTVHVDLNRYYTYTKFFSSPGSSCMTFFISLLSKLHTRSRVEHDLWTWRTVRAPVLFEAQRSIYMIATVRGIEAVWPSSCAKRRRPSHVFMRTRR
ncbi:hypothetical protein EVAR_54006_1 [Eumeta japonica]|uniref:Uncharacterized protein n=1 Tax=Eumeta variegata TaxID=151549 RepID=A0A4C1YP29_EUMVA|nr:hypothetical protein EVAR_54006_1 [Eumeta japonica]